MKTTTLIPYFARRPMFSSLFDDMDDFFASSPDWPSRFTAGQARDFETADNEDHYLMSFDLPGMKKENLKIEVKDRILTVEGERRGYMMKRSFTLPESVESDAIEAKYEDGVLELYLPKAAKTQARAIEVQSGKTGIFAKLLDRGSSREVDVKKQ